jgi:hypothetical protein
MSYEISAQNLASQHVSHAVHQCLGRLLQERQLVAAHSPMPITERVVAGQDRTPLRTSPPRPRASPETCSFGLWAGGARSGWLGLARARGLAGRLGGDVAASAGQINVDCRKRASNRGDSAALEFALTRSPEAKDYVACPIAVDEPDRPARSDLVSGCCCLLTGFCAFSLELQRLAIGGYE